MAYLGLKGVFKVPFIFTRFDNRFPNAHVYQVNEDDNVCYQPARVFTHMKTCCCTYECLKDFTELKDGAKSAALHTFVDCEDQVEIFPGFCPACGLPSPSHECFKFIVVDMVHRLENYMNEEGDWYPLQTESELTLMWFNLRRGVQLRYKSGQVRRQLLNILIVHPYSNCFRFTHQVVKNFPKGSNPVLLIRDILLQGIKDLDNDILIQPAHHCHCNAPGSSQQKQSETINVSSDSHEYVDDSSLGDIVEGNISSVPGVLSQSAHSDDSSAVVGFLSQSARSDDLPDLNVTRRSMENNFIQITPESSDSSDDDCIITYTEGLCTPK